MRVPHKISAVLCVLVSSATLLSTLVAPVQAEDGQLPVAIQIEGRGYGHGRGMSQYGSYGYATVYGWSWDAILNFYYGGATGNTLGSLADPGQEMTTWLSAMNNAQTAVISDGNNAVFLQDPTPGRTCESRVSRVGYPGASLRNGWSRPGSRRFLVDWRRAKRCIIYHHCWSRPSSRSNTTHWFM
jgi:hypothetical protein